MNFAIAFLCQFFWKIIYLEKTENVIMLCSE